MGFQKVLFSHWVIAGGAERFIGERVWMKVLRAPMQSR